MKSAEGHLMSHERKGHRYQGQPMSYFKSSRGWRYDLLVRRVGEPRPLPSPAPQVANVETMAEMKRRGVRRPLSFDLLATVLQLFSSKIMSPPLCGLFGPSSCGKTSGVKKLAEILQLDYHLENCADVRADNDLASHLKRKSLHQWCVMNNNKPKLLGGFII